MEKKRKSVRQILENLKAIRRKEISSEKIEEFNRIIEHDEPLDTGKEKRRSVRSPPIISADFDIGYAILSSKGMKDVVMPDSVAKKYRGYHFSDHASACQKLVDKMARVEGDKRPIAIPGLITELAAIKHLVN